jgi:gamma-glutamyltranspeptidase/glutathione hydrolase
MANGSDEQIFYILPKNNFLMFKKLYRFLFIFLMPLVLRSQKEASSAMGVVASAHPLATSVGIEILGKGGNAFDAATAVSFVLAVTEPSMSGIGGRLQALYYSQGKGFRGIDATTQVPKNYIPDEAKAEDGYQTIGIPGMVKGILKLHGEMGILPRSSVLAPAVKIARKGFTVLPDELQRQAMVKKSLELFPGSRKHFLSADTTGKTNALFKQGALSKTLKSISKDGGVQFYKGKIAHDISSEIKLGGGFIQLSDMQQYQTPDARILKGTYRGYEIIAMGLPCYGAIAIEMLHLLEKTDLTEANETQWVLANAAAHYKSYEDRPLLYKEEDKIISASFAEMRWRDSLPVSMKYDANSHQDGHTTHYVVSDKYGNIVTVTQSLGPLLGSKVASEKYGFLFATTMGPYLGKMVPLERASSHISPIMVFKEGKPVLALGAAGGARIIPAIVQVISRFIDQNLPIEKAMKAARVYQLPDKLLIENHSGDIWQESDTVENLRKLNLPLEEVKLPGLMGRVHALHYDSKKGLWRAAADPDWSGTAAGIPSNIK